MPGVPDSMRCNWCGAETSLDLSPEGLCPACLLSLAEAPTLTRPDSARPPIAGSGMIAAGQHFGPYRIERLLGKGGMGEVYEAEGEDGRRVALKVLTHGLDDEIDRARFLREGRLAASLSHPHTVYVYGADEIEGVPVIAMELATGGTLKDRVKNEGPLTPTEAVDAILDVIAGLQAAEAVGILHRDIKPSNCFLDGKGRVKVGDFGLSISTLARAEQDLSVAGSFLGTPAFTSPEQLRTDDLDVRSDIYSVGATLFYLLTGRPPFEETNSLRLVTMIAQQPAPSLSELKPNVPSGLATVVMRCLAKAPGDRFPTHAALARELEMFSSSVPRPASAGRRFAAGLVDWFVLGILLAPATVFLDWTTMRSPMHFSGVARQLTYLLLGTVYFVFLEVRFGASVGKVLCGLRVGGLDGSQPGLWQALARGALFQLAMRVPSLFGSPEDIASPHPPIYFQLLGAVALDFQFGVARFWYAGLATLFVTMRRRNGFAGLHDLLSQTRVVVRSTTEARSIARTSADVPSASAAHKRVGPYQVVQHLSDNLLLGYDGRLRRKVWIRIVLPETPALPLYRRDLSRPSRLHWLTGRRAPGEYWDAYEAVDGKPLVRLLCTVNPWSRVRHWLRDLATELSVGMDDQSSADLALDRVWITPGQRAKLLDWPAPGVEGDPSHVIRSEAVGLRTAQEFLSVVASSALLGRAVRDAPGLAAPAEPLPLSARRFLQELAGQRFQSVRQVGKALDSLIAGPARVHHRTRWIHLAIWGALPALVWIYFIPTVVLWFQWGAQHTERFELATCVHQLHRLKKHADAGTTPPREELQRIGLGDVEVKQIIQALEVHVAEQFRARTIDPSIWEQPFMDRRWRTAAAWALAEHPSPSAKELDEAANIVGRFLENRRAEFPNSAEFLGFASVALPLIPLIFLGAIGLLSAPLFRGGLIFRLLGVGVVNASGEETSRARAFVRAMIAWSPFLLAGLAVFWPDADRDGWHLGLVHVVLLTLVLAGIAWAVFNPRRGLQDRLAGTYLVPR